MELLATGFYVRGIPTSWQSGFFSNSARSRAGEDTGSSRFEVFCAETLFFRDRGGAAFWRLTHRNPAEGNDLYSISILQSLTHLREENSLVFQRMENEAWAEWSVTAGGLFRPKTGTPSRLPDALSPQHRFLA